MRIVGARYQKKDQVEIRKERCMDWGKQEAWMEEARAGQEYLRLRGLL